MISVVVVMVVVMVVVVTTNLIQSCEYPDQQQHWRRGWQVSRVRAIGGHEQPCCLVGSLHLGQRMFVKPFPIG